MERQISDENTSNFATTYPPEIPKESSKVVPQYGMEGTAMDVWEVGLFLLPGSLREWRV
jgi:hypothetical protein